MTELKKMKKPFAVIYFSGAGNTGAVAEKIKEHIEKYISAEIYRAESMPEDFSADDYAAVILGTPVYHSEPAEPIIKFLESTSHGRKVPAFIFTTCGMYPENCLRTFAKKCLRHGMVPIHSASYRCSATDGMLLAPFMECWFKNEDGLELKIKKDTDIFIEKLRSHSGCEIPKPKWYALLNYPNKMLGRAITFPIYLHKDRCVKCGKCRRECPIWAVSENVGYPAIDKRKCINCYRCIHHCPFMALSLFKNKRTERVWSEN